MQVAIEEKSGINKKDHGLISCCKTRRESNKIKIEFSKYWSAKSQKLTLDKQKTIKSLNSWIR